jgi:TolB protein
MNADGTGQVQLTENAIGDLTPSWSPDGKKIVFHRRVGERGQFQLFLINPDGTGEKQLTFPPGLNAFPNWGEVRSRAPLK